MSELVRNELADAANTVEGISVAPYFRQSTKPGAGVVQLARVEWPNRLGAEAYWQLLILLPSDIAAAQKRSEALIPLLYAALKDYLVITGIELARTQLDTSGGGTPCVLISGHRGLE
jgi:hypothetical protein